MIARGQNRKILRWVFFGAVWVGLHFLPMPPWYVFVGLGFAIFGGLLWGTLKASPPV